MGAFENAQKFFEACETSQGWMGCKPYVAEGATFSAQCEPLVGIRSLEDYCEWMGNLGTVLAPGATYDLHTASYSPESRSAVFFATIHVKHTGEGGPVPPTGREAHSEYVYILRMNAEDQVEHLTKVWNPAWANRELGWV